MKFLVTSVYTFENPPLYIHAQIIEGDTVENAISNELKKKHYIPKNIAQMFLVDAYVHYTKDKLSKKVIDKIFSSEDKISLKKATKLLYDFIMWSYDGEGDFKSNIYRIDENDELIEYRGEPNFDWDLDDLEDEYE